MTTETKIRTKAVADDDPAMRTLEVSLGKTKIITPSKSLDAKLVSTKDSPSFDGGNLNEISFSFSSDKIQKLLLDQVVNRKLNSDFKKYYYNSSSRPSASFIDFKTDVPQLPTESEIAILTNYAYTYSDITPIPSVSRFGSSNNINSENFDELCCYIKSAISSIEEWNHKPIMGYIPLLGPLYLTKLVDLYVDAGINAFYLDFNTKGFTDLTAITAIKKRLGKAGLSENHFIHIINMSYDKANKDAAVLPARDFLEFGMGLDSLGNTHRGRAIKKEEGIPPVPGIERKVRVFDREGYGYHRIDSVSLSDGDTPYPRSAFYTRDEILSAPSVAKKLRMMNLVNYQEQVTECSHLQTLVSEGEKTLDYFNGKSCLDNRAKERLKSFVSQMR